MGNLQTPPPRFWERNQSLITVPESNGNANAQWLLILMVTVPKKFPNPRRFSHKIWRHTWWHTPVCSFEISFGFYWGMLKDSAKDPSGNELWTIVIPKAYLMAVNFSSVSWPKIVPEMTNVAHNLAGLRPKTIGGQQTTPSTRGAMMGYTYGEFIINKDENFSVVVFRKQLWGEVGKLLWSVQF